MGLSVLIWLPLAISLVAVCLPARLTPRFTAVLSLATLGVAIDFLVRFRSGTAGLQFSTDKIWISALGIHYAVAVNGLNIALMLLTTVLFTASLAWSSCRDIDRPREYYFWFGVAESSVLGAFAAQDLILFVGFFDLMLIPFYFLLGMWGTGERIRATVKMVIYTACGSFLMLAAAIATGVLVASHYGTPINFTFSWLKAHPLGGVSQDWIFLCFAAAFLVKMPLVPFHGWLRDAYKSMPIPVVAVFSGVLSKVAAFGFLQIVLPIYPGASHHFQLLVLIVAVVSILWATAMAFTTRDIRLVIAYSSVAQLAFITLGIFSLHPEGGQGALLQMVNHGLVTAGLFFVLGVVAQRAGGSENMDDMGGVAFRAPVLATMFVILTFANLAMPGSSNFIGEFMILLGTFNAKLPIAVLAFVGVIGAAYYALRMFIGMMHNRVGTGVRSRELALSDAIAIVPLVAIVLVLAFYPQFGLSRSEASLKDSIQAAAAVGGRAGWGPYQPASQIASARSAGDGSASALQIPAAGSTTVSGNGSTTVSSNRSTTTSGS